MLYRYNWWGQLQKTTTIPDSKLFVSHLIFIQLTKDLLWKHIEFDLNYVELIFFGKKRLILCFRTSICRIHCIDQFKTFTLLLKYKIIDFETLSHIHVYRIEYVSYRQGLYRIRIDTADDRIVPALVFIWAFLKDFIKAFIPIMYMRYLFSPYIVWATYRSWWPRPHPAGTFWWGRSPAPRSWFPSSTAPACCRTSPHSEDKHTLVKHLGRIAKSLAKNLKLKKFTYQ